MRQCRALTFAMTVFQQHRRLREAYGDVALDMKFLTKLYREMEFLLLDKRNVELVNNKLKVVHAAFVNYEQAHIVYLESPRDSVNHHGTSATKSSQRSSSRLSVKIKEAKVERAVAELRLQQLKKKLELQERCDVFLQRQELGDAENDIEAAALKARILEAGIGDASIIAEHERVQSVPSFEQKPSMDQRKRMLPPTATSPLEELPLPAKHQKMLNPNAAEWFAKPFDRDQSDGSLQQFVQQQQQLMQLH